MENTQNQKNGSKKWIILIAVIAAIAIIGGIIYFVSSDSDSKDKKNKTTTESSDKQTDSDNDSDVSGSSVVETDSEETTTLSIEDAPEPTLNPQTANDVVLDTDPEPEITLKQNQKTFNDCMAAQDYAGAKTILDSYFATSEYSIWGNNTYDNYVYYYEKQDLYTESAMYQIDFLEREMGLVNIVEGNTKYQKLLETLKYVSVDDPRLAEMETSVKRWKEIDELLNNNKVDTAITKLKDYISGCMDCVYAFHYLAKAYEKKADYFNQARTYYIFLLKLQQREANVLEKSYEVVFLEHANALYDMYRITDEERRLMEDTLTADTLPW